MTLLVKVTYNDGVLLAADAKGMMVEAGEVPGTVISEKWYTDDRGFVIVAAGENNFSRTVFGKIRADTTVTGENVHSKVSELAKKLSTSQDREWRSNLSYSFYVCAQHQGAISTQMIGPNFCDKIDKTSKYYTVGHSTALFSQIACLKIHQEKLDKEGAVELVLALIDLVADAHSDKVGDVKRWGANVVGVSSDGQTWHLPIENGTDRPSIFTAIAKLIDAKMVEVPR